MLLGRYTRMAVSLVDWNRPGEIAKRKGRAWWRVSLESGSISAISV